MNSGGRRFRWEKYGQHPGHGHAGVGHANEDLFGGSDGAGIGDDDGGGLAEFGGGEVGCILGKRQIARPRAIGGGKTREQNRGVADDFALELLRNISSGE